MTRRPKLPLLLAAAGLALALPATEYGLERAARSALAEAGFGIERLDVDLLSGTTIARGLTGHGLEVGAVRLPLGVSLVSRAEAQGAPVVVEKLEYRTLYTRISIPRVEITGARVNAATARRLLDDGARETLAERMRALDGATFTIPEMKLTQKLEVALGGDKQSSDSSTSYRGITAGVLKDGVLARVTIDSAALIFVDTTGKGVATFGKGAVETVDLGHILAIFSEPAGAGPNERKLVYGPSHISDMRLEVNEENGTTAEIGVDRIEFGSLSMRRLKTPINQWEKAFEGFGKAFGKEFERFRKAPRAERVRFWEFVEDAVGSYSATGSTVKGVTMRVPDSADKSKTLRFTVAQATTAALEGLAFGPTRVSGIAIGDGDGAMTLDRAVLGGFDFSATMAAAREAVTGERVPEEAELDWRKLMPTYEGFRFDGAAIDIPDEQRAGERIKFTIGSGALELGQWVKGIPTRVRAGIADIRAEVSDLPKSAEGYEALVASGVGHVDATFGVGFVWSRDKGDLAIDQLYASSNVLGSLDARSKLVNLPSDLVEGSIEELGAGLMGLRMTETSLSLKAAAPLGALLDAVARKDGTTRAALLEEVAKETEASLRPMVGQGPNGKRIVEAVGRFLRDPSSLAMVLKSKQPAGVPIIGVIGTQNAAILIDRMDLTIDGK